MHQTLCHQSVGALGATGAADAAGGAVGAGSRAGALEGAASGFCRRFSLVVDQN